MEMSEVKDHIIGIRNYVSTISSASDTYELCEFIYNICDWLLPHIDYPGNTNDFNNFFDSSFEMYALGSVNDSYKYSRTSQKHEGFCFYEIPEIKQKYLYQKARFILYAYLTILIQFTNEINEL